MAWGFVLGAILRLPEGSEPAFSSLLVLDHEIGFSLGPWRGGWFWARFGGFLRARNPLSVFFWSWFVGSVFYGNGDVGVHLGRGFGVSWGLGTLFWFSFGLGSSD